MEINSNMPDEFFEWLNECPVQWFLIKSDDEDMEYSFTVPTERELIETYGRIRK